MKTTWKRNLIILSFAQLLTMMGFSAYHPSIPFYIQQLGGFGYEEAAAWNAMFQGGSAIAMAIASPIWGTVSDRYGRKLMLVRATGAGAILALVMAFVQTPGQLVAVRIVQGALCGTVSAAMVLVSTQTPDEHLGTALGVMQTVQFLGNAIGPLVGGLVADSLGYRSVFPVSSVMMAISFLSVAFLVKEKFVRPARVASKERRFAGIGVLWHGNIPSLLFTLWTMSFALSVVGTILSLYIKSLSPDEPYIATLAGSVLSVSALASALAAFGVGRLGDKYGQKRTLMICGLGAAIMYVPQAFVTTPIQLLWIKAIEGLFVGGMMPTANALLAHSTPSARRGTVFGFSNSVTASGRAIGPILGAAVASSLGMSRVFLVTAGVYLISVLAVALLVRPKTAELLTEGTGAPAASS